MNYYRRPNKDNYGDDIRNLNYKIDIVYTSLGNIIEERNDLLQLFNSRINDNIPDDNIFNDDIKVDDDNRFKLIFTCKSEPSDIYKYVFHIFIKSDFNNINLKFIINNKDFNYDILDKKLNNYHTKFHKINEMIDIIMSDEYTKIYKTHYPMKNYDLSQDRFFIYSEIIDNPLKKNTYIIFEYIFEAEYIDIPLINNLKIDDVLEKDFDIN